MERLPTDLSVELAELRARLAALEAERTVARRRGRWIGGAVYSVTAATSGSLRGFDVQCISSTFTAFAPMRNMVVTCSRLVTP